MATDAEIVNLFAAITATNGRAIAPSPSVDLSCLAAAGVFGDRIKYVFKFGHNPDLDSGADEDVWAGGGNYAFYPASAVSIEALSSSADDDGSPTGTGARTLTITGLDADGAEQSATITLNGTTPVAVPGTWLRVFEAYAATVGSAGANAGAITVRQVTVGTVAAYILAGDGQSLQASYTVPAGYRGILLGGHISVGKLADATGDLKIRPNGGAWRTLVHHHLYEAQIALDGCVIGVLDALSDVRVRCNTAGTNVEVSADFHLLLVKSN